MGLADNVNNAGEVTDCNCLCHTRGVRQHGNKDCGYCVRTQCGVNDLATPELVGSLSVTNPSNESLTDSTNDKEN